MLEVKEGRIYVNGKETINHELIALAFKDFAEKLHEKGMNFDSGLIYSQNQNK